MTPLDRLLALERFGIKLGLDNIRTLLDALGHPEREWPAIHIGGTNGKGSVSAMVEAALRATGHRTGRYTSPHLDRLEERVAIDGVPVESGTLTSTIARVLDEVDRLHSHGHLPAPPTFFEVTTAVAFEIFRLARVDVAVVEVGLGGRFDATNAITPAVTAITSIDFDHEKYLGRTLAAIAFEKAGIAKAGVPLVLGRVAEDAHAVIAQVCGERGAPLLDAAREVRTDVAFERGRARMSVSTPVRSYPRFALALAGAHQARNAAVAIRTLEAGADRGIAVGPADIVSGLTSTRWPARLEWLRTTHGALLVDAAHNPAGARALAEYLRDAGVAPLPIVMAVMEDKDITAMVGGLAPAASRFIATEVPARRALRAPDLAEAIRRTAADVPVEARTNPDEAVARAFEHGTRAVVAGSIFLVGPLRARLIDRGARPIEHPDTA